MADVLALLVSISTWAAPQPVYSAGRLVIYGGDQLTRANAEWHGYTLDGYAFGLSAISPAMLGRVAWVRVPGGAWQGPGLVIDAVGRADAYRAIYETQEVAEITWATAEALGFANGGRWGYVYFGACPPADGPETRGQEWSDYTRPERYAPPLVIDEPPYEGHVSFWPYPPQQRVTVC